MKKFLLICFLSFVWFTYSYADTDFAGGLYDKIIKTNTKKGLVAGFCNYIQDKENILPAVIGGKKPDPSKSIFLYFLCKSTGIDSKFKTNLSNYINDKSKKYYSYLTKQKSFGGIVDECMNSQGFDGKIGSLNSVDFICVAKDIWDKLASDLTNIMLMNVYGIGGKKSILDWEADIFGTNLCDKGNYLTGDKVYCKHKDTYSYLKDVNDDLKPILGNLNLLKLNASNLGNFLSKAAIYNTNGDLYKINSSIYNELYFYNLFLAYYGFALKYYQDKYTYIDYGNKGQTIESFNLRGSMEFDKAYNEILMSQIIIAKTIQTLKDIFWTFPIHIGFMAIYEDLKNFRHALAKIYTPIDQLRYKLKNVQDLDKQ